VVITLRLSAGMSAWPGPREVLVPGGMTLEQYLGLPSPVLTPRASGLVKSGTDVGTQGEYVKERGTWLGARLRDRTYGKHIRLSIHART
jgi:hypothetical protein